MMQDSQFTKWRLDQIWNTRGCVCPNHLVAWHLHQKGFRFYDKERLNILAWFTKGSLRRGRIKKLKGKGFSFLAKGYYVAWRGLRNDT